MKQHVGTSFDSMKLMGAPNVYMVGCFDERVTLYAQQVRSLNLVFSLQELGAIHRGQKVAVIGGGLAGLTTAAALTEIGLKVQVIEKNPELLSRFRGSSSRWLHPYLHDWPMEWSTRFRSAGLPIMNWECGSVDEVLERLETEWEHYKPHVNVDKNAQIEKLDLDSRRIEWIKRTDDGNFKKRNEGFDTIIFAVGFGHEPQYGLDLPRFWEADDFDQDDREGRERSWLVSGSGDGGLADIIRLCLKNVNSLRFFDEVLSGDEFISAELRAEILEIETSERAKVDSTVLSKFYKKLRIDPLMERLKPLIRWKNRVYLNVADKNFYSSRASAPNRLIVSQLEQLGVLNPASFVTGRIESRRLRKTSNDKFEVPFRGGVTRTFDRIVMRHGPITDLKDDFPDVWEKSQHARVDRLEHKFINLELNRERNWPLDYWGPETRPFDLQQDIRKYIDGIHSFESMMDDVFTITVDKSQKSKNIPRQLFWDLAYRPRALDAVGDPGRRPNELKIDLSRKNESTGREIFTSFIEHQSWEILLVTGHLGAGKTTFLYDKLENYELCGGLVIDCEDFPGFVDGNPTENYQSRIRTIIKYQVIRELSEHFLAFIRKSISKKRLRHRTAGVLRRIEHAIAEIESGPDKEFALDLTVAALLVSAELHTELGMQAGELLRENGYAAAPNEDISDRLIFIGKCLTNDRTYRNNLIRDHDEAEWVQAYFSFFWFHNPVLVFDNTDSCPTSFRDAELYTYMVELQETLNSAGKSYRNIEGESRDISLIYAVRDQNVTSLNKQNSSVVNRNYVELGPNYFSANEDVAHKRLVELSHTALREIVSARLGIAKRICPDKWASRLRDFGRLVACFWDDTRERSYFDPAPEHKQKTGPTSFRLRDANNHSLRLSLDMVCRSTLDAMKDLEFRNIKVEDYVETTYYLAHRGRISRWLATKSPRTSYLTQQNWRDSFTQMLMGERPCFPHRLILTMLLKEDDSCTVEECLELINSVTGIPKSELLNAIWNLFDSGHEQGSFLYIFQNGKIDAPLEIRMNATLKISPRGMAFIRFECIGIDYWGTFLENSYKHNLLFEESCDVAARYVTQVVAFVGKYADHHRELWLNKIAPRIRSEFGDLQHAFQAYREKLTFGNEFFVERVCQSHSASCQLLVKQQLYRCQADPNAPQHKLLMNVYERYRHYHKLEQFYEMADEFQTIAPTGLQGPIGSIIDSIHKYQEIIKTFSELRGTTVPKPGALKRKRESRQSDLEE